MNKKELIIISFLAAIILISTISYLMLTNHSNKVIFPNVTPKPTTTTINTTVDNYDKEYPLIAFVKPVFTAAAYNGFYTFYANTSLDPQQYLIQQVPNSWGTSNTAPTFIKQLITDGYPPDRIVIINDTNVNNGEIFNINGYPKYDVLVFFHAEYVTLQEYVNVYTFISKGGNVLILNGNAFYAEVSYNITANTVMLVYGHGFKFDGQNVTQLPFKTEFYNVINQTNDRNWVGSTFTTYLAGKLYGAYFHIDSTNPNPVATEMKRQGINAIALPYVGKYNKYSTQLYYMSHEENSLITKNADIIADWRTSFSQVDYGIKIYEIFPAGAYGGSLIHFGAFGTDILPYDRASREFFLIAVRHQVGYYFDDWIRFPMNNAILTSNNVVLDYVSSTTNISVILNGIDLGYLTTKTGLGILPNGQYLLTIIFNYTFGCIIRSVHFAVNNDTYLHRYHLY